MTITSLCVFCGSNTGRGPRYVDGARRLGRHLAEEGITVVYGGASVGTMGTLADAALEAGGAVIGVIPRQQTGQEIAHQGLTELYVVESMHERKAKMVELAGGFIALPGGLGTLEEFAEVLTWSQLGIHSLPTGLLDTDGYYGHFLAFLDHAVAEGFLRQGDRDLVLAGQDPAELVDALRTWAPAGDQHWQPVE
ncbi:TIGR00730 family Rossman fold protein [Pseudonocardia sp. KRD-184]|uniref:Cytokinin riboside 5'-monophosphate phosphoribohydrolase n=2 Tax=Pseudonocardia oceani TaxID=2792013 RepID=A0ABS6UHC3_9PSEU|nr:TIGR00730 family Rossman fold protein [Pseudonocardia oceani]MBW0097110.1 TIGR00730 family Rossman fold protein [Pseudonocardia oceani]MBW0110901.1 TIGR00730 family Rossman fold protein [Pseudonocardia oceani]MBW0123937.1 TIGR00730 family Rossman fold protein [Pseudonocardia oceani]MBW0131660.1 TIGR00730 family Rossman fold protein [Pseudonocardia oceani]